MNIVDFLYQDLNSTKNYVKMLQASLYTINDFSDYLENVLLKEHIEMMQITNDDLLEEINKLLIKSGNYM